MDVSRKQGRRVVGYLALLAWAATVLLPFGWCVRGDSWPGPLWIMGQVIAITAGGSLSAVWLLSRPLAPVQESYRLGYEAGLRDGIAAGRPGARVVHLPRTTVT